MSGRVAVLWSSVRSSTSYMHRPVIKTRRNRIFPLACTALSSKFSLYSPAKILPWPGQEYHRKERLPIFSVAQNALREEREVEHSFPADLSEVISVLVYTYHFHCVKLSDASADHRSAVSLSPVFLRILFLYAKLYANHYNACRDIPKIISPL